LFDLNSYLPESLLMRDKDQDHIRLSSEACAVLDPFDGYRVIACRGQGLSVGERFLPIRSLPPAEQRFLDASLGQREHIFLQNGKLAVLLFSDFLSFTGLCLAILPQGDARAIRRVLHFLGRDAFRSAPEHAEESVTPHAGDDALCRHMAELFYYLDRIGKPSASVDLRTRVQWLCNFTGIRLRDTRLPALSVSLTRAEEVRLTVFLLCLFLSLRRKSNHGDAIRVNEEKTLSFSIELHTESELSRKHYELSEAELRAFSSLRAFREFELEALPDGYRLLARFAHSGQLQLLHSSGAPCNVLCLRFHFVS